MKALNMLKVYAVPQFLSQPFTMPVLMHQLHPLFVSFPEASAYSLAPLQFLGISKLIALSRIQQIVRKFKDLANCQQVSRIQQIVRIFQDLANCLQISRIQQILCKFPGFSKLFAFSRIKQIVPKFSGFSKLFANCRIDQMGKNIWTNNPVE